MTRKRHRLTARPRKLVMFGVAYGPNWRFKIPRMPVLIWRRAGWCQFKRIQVAPWNVKPRRVRA